MVQRKPKLQSPATILKLAEKRRDPEIVMHLQAMLKDAMEGKVAGLLVAVHYGGKEFAYIGAGSMCECPTLGIASAHKLATKLLHPNK